MPVLGIDLGTTFSAMAYLDRNGTPITVPNAEGELTTPSVVLFEQNGDLVVGREARRAALCEPDRVVECVKRYMGDDFYPFTIDGQRFTPSAISALILKKLKQDAELRVGPIEGAVITVPAYFDEVRRRSTAEAGRLAGLHVIDIVNEPTAAALAYAYRRFKDPQADRTVEEVGKDIASQKPSTAVVYDLGGGTFDVTLIRIDGADLQVLATGGDVHLGGRDWDERLTDYMAGEFLAAHETDPRQDPISRQNLMLTAEEAKRVLSQRRQATFVINHAGSVFRGDITRDKFNQLTEDLLYRTESRVGRVIRQAELTWENVDQVLLVGGSTRMPQVQEMLRRVTGREPDCSLSPDEAVAHGAAIHAAITMVKAAADAPSQTAASAVAQEETASPAQAESAPPVAAPPAKPVVQRPNRPAAPSAAAATSPAGPMPAVNSPTLGRPHPTPQPQLVTQSPAESPNIPFEPEVFRSSSAPAATTSFIGTPVSTGYTAPESDRGSGSGLLVYFNHAVARLLRNFRTVNVNAHTLGVLSRLSDGRRRVIPLIPHNTPLPTTVRRSFGTFIPNQSSVTVRIVEGESESPDECIEIGSCSVNRLPKGLPKGTPIEVAFSYDNSGRIHVTATEPRSGVRSSMVFDRQAAAALNQREQDAERRVLQARVS